jgi:hypothetical protein
MTKDQVRSTEEALKLAKSWFEANTYGDEAVEVYEAIEQALSDATHLAAPVQEVQEVQEWMKPHPKCDWSCMYHCTYGFSRFPECAAPEKGQP